MHTVDLHDTPFSGVSRSTTWAPSRHRLECRSCGSSLAGRREGVRRRGDEFIETWRCPCGAGRHVKREAAAV